MVLLGGRTVPPDSVSVVPHHAAAFGAHDPEVALRAGVQNANSLPCGRTTLRNSLWTEALRLANAAVRRDTSDGD